MIEILVPLLIALACAPASAVVLTRGRWQVWHPAMALACWCSIGVLGLAVFSSSIAVACLHAVTETGSPSIRLVAFSVLAWAGLGGIGVLGSIGLLAEQAGHDADARARTHRDHPLVLRRRRFAALTSGTPVSQVQSARPFAYAEPGRPGQILVSSALCRDLSSAQLAVILAHEDAHLRGHHHLLRRLGAIHAACLPKTSRLRRDLVCRLHLLTELAADDRAARQCGADQTIAALHRVQEIAPTPELLVRAARLRSCPGRGQRNPVVEHTGSSRRPVIDTQ